MSENKVLKELQPIVLENQRISVKTILQGAKTVSIYDKLHQKEWLWRNPNIGLHAYATEFFDDEWFGGMDDMFPNDAACCDRGVNYPDHGLMWHDIWKVKENKSPYDKQIELVLEKNGFTFTKILSLSSEDNKLHLYYKISNTSGKDVEYIFRLHPSFSLHADTLLKVPGKWALCDEEFNHPKSISDSYCWPVMPIDTGCINMSDFNEYIDQQTAFQYIKLDAGHFGLVDQRNNCSIHYIFDIGSFPYLTVFLTNGGYKGLRTVAIEPSTGMFADIEKSSVQNQTRVLKNNEFVVFDMDIKMTTHLSPSRSSKFLK